MKITQQLKNELERRLILEGIHRIQYCVEKLSDAQLWYRPNANCNSIGNLILHLDGNVRQWLIATFAGIKDQRKREAEFNLNSKIDKATLMNKLEVLRGDISDTISTISKETLKSMYNVQCYRESGTSIVVHVIEHFSYHVGQITLMTKILLDIDTGYYKDDDLNFIN